jgi:hypothetical protein
MLTNVDHEELLDARVAAVAAAVTAAALAARLIAWTPADVSVIVLLQAFLQVEKAAQESRLAHAEIFALLAVVTQGDFRVRRRRSARLAAAFRRAGAVRSTAGAAGADWGGAVGKADTAGHEKDQRRGAESYVKLFASHGISLLFRY